jgi:hypothetical protein
VDVIENRLTGSLYHNALDEDYSDDEPYEGDEEDSWSDEY